MTDSYMYSRSSFMAGFRFFWRILHISVTAGFRFMAGWSLGLTTLMVLSALGQMLVRWVWRSL